MLLECSDSEEESEAQVSRVLVAELVPRPTSSDPNRGLEGVVLHESTVYVAFERDDGGQPHVYAGPLPPRGTRMVLKPLPIPFSRVPPRVGKGELNLNGLDLLPGPPAVLILLARDQERLLFYELETGSLSWVDLDFRDPSGEPIYWASPEGVAVDPPGGRLWIISDPDSVRGNYRRQKDATARDEYLQMVPLLFSLPLEPLRKVLRPAAGETGREPSAGPDDTPYMAWTSLELMSRVIMNPLPPRYSKARSPAR